MAALTNDEILEAIANMTVQQAADLVKAMEEKFGVSAAAPVAVAAGPAAAAEEEQTEFTVTLESIDPAKKMDVIKAVKAATGLEKSQADKVLGSCAWMLLLLSLLITAIMLVFGRPILLLFGASTQTIGFAVDYMNIYCLGTAFVDAVQRLLALGADVNKQNAYTRDTAILRSVYGDHDEITRLLIYADADLNLPNNYRQTPMGWR